MKLLRPPRTTCLAVLLLAACDGGPPAAPATEVRDSAGVRIVFSRRPAGSSSRTRIGTVTLELGAGAPTFHQVVGALRLSDGGVVVADGGDQLVHRFSSEGNWLGSTGGVGDGPSEYRILQAMGRLTGDTIWTYDFSHRRVSILSPELELARSIVVRPPLPSGLAVGVLRGDTVLIGESWSSTGVAEVLSPGLSREDVAYVRYGPDGAMIDTLATVPGREVLIHHEDGRGVMGSAPLGRMAVRARLGPGFAVGDQTRHQVAVVASDGVTRRILRWEGGDLMLDDETREAWRDARIEGVPPERQAAVARRVADMPMPDRRPAYGPILGTESGELWIGAYAMDGEVPATWEVFDTAGVWRETVRAPEGFRPLEVGGEWVLGVAVDPLGVQTVELRRLERGP